MDYFFPFPWTSASRPFYAHQGLFHVNGITNTGEKLIFRLATMEERMKNASTEVSSVKIFTYDGDWKEKPIVEVRDIRRKARLGFWSLVFSLHHTAVELRFDDGGTIICEKNGDTGVWLRHTRLGESFSTYAAYPTPNLTFGSFFTIVRGLDSFHEPIERANCQHLSFEILEALVDNGYIQTKERPRLANHDLALKWRDYGLLDKDLKYEVKSNRVHGELFQKSMCWGLKGAFTRLFCPWIHTFHLCPVIEPSPVPSIRDHVHHVTDHVHHVENDENRKPGNSLPGKENSPPPSHTTLLSSHTPAGQPTVVSPSPPHCYAPSSYGLARTGNDMMALAATQFVIDATMGGR